jgi:hypothetical protein
MNFKNNDTYDMYWLFNSNNSEDETTSIFNIDDFYKEVKFEIGKTYTFKVNDLSNINDNSDETKDDYIQYIKDKNKITILINWMEVCSSDEDGIDCNVGFSFVN